MNSLNKESASIFSSLGKTKTINPKQKKINEHENKRMIGKVMKPKAYSWKISIELTSF